MFGQKTNVSSFKSGDKDLAIRFFVYPLSTEHFKLDLPFQCLVLFKFISFVKSRCFLSKPSRNIFIQQLGLG